MFLSGTILTHRKRIYPTRRRHHHQIRSCNENVQQEKMIEPVQSLKEVGQGTVQKESKASKELPNPRFQPLSNISGSGNTLPSLSLLQSMETGPHYYDGQKKSYYAPDEIRTYLAPTLNTLFDERESFHFRLPVNTMLYHDYLNIVKRPMDLSTVKQKLFAGEYNDYWQYIDDVWTIFYNAWLYNRPKSEVYRHAHKLADVFLDQIEPVRKALGYCCGQKHQYDPPNLQCFGKTNNTCSIGRHAVYYSYDDRYALCPECFKKFKGEVVSLRVENDEEKPLEHLRKNEFVKTKNDCYEPEKFVKCTVCEKEFHQICVMYMEEMQPTGFVCDNCLTAKNLKREENKFTAKRLPMSIVSDYIERRVKVFLQNNGIYNDVFIRELSCIEKVLKFEPVLGLINDEDLNKEFPYRAKAIFAFQEIDGVDVCIFGMHVQEYGSECPPPNTRRVYIAYIDSVHFFRPRRFRTNLYHEIILGYLHYVKNLGFLMAHIWACPPNDGDDYIFNRHPRDQKTPKADRLQEWYKVMLDKGTEEGIILQYHDIHKQAILDNMKKAADLPIFEGDFWRIFFEGFMRELGKQLKIKKQGVKAIGEKENGEMRDVSPKCNSSRRKSNPSLDSLLSSSEIRTKLLTALEKYKEVFFVISLNPPQIRKSVPKITDPDGPIECHFVDSRDAFLSLARERSYEFSSLRRAKFSSMAILYDLHNFKDRQLYHCNSCGADLDLRWNCATCTDFDLCDKCFEKNGHMHPVEKKGRGISAPVENQPSQEKILEAFELRLLHSDQCRNGTCGYPGCFALKATLGHLSTCKNKRECRQCRVVKHVCHFHIAKCRDKNCAFDYCNRARLLRRRTEAQQTLPFKQMIQSAQIQESPAKPTNNCSSGFPVTTQPSQTNSNVDNVKTVTQPQIVQEVEILPSSNNEQVSSALQISSNSGLQEKEGEPVVIPSQGNNMIQGRGPQKMFLTIPVNQVRQANGNPPIQLNHSRLPGDNTMRYQSVVTSQLPPPGLIRISQHQQMPQIQPKLQTMENGTPVVATPQAQVPVSQIQQQSQVFQLQAVHTPNSADDEVIIIEKDDQMENNQMTCRYKESNEDVKRVQPQNIQRPMQIQQYKVLPHQNPPTQPRFPGQVNVRVPLSSGVSFTRYPPASGKRPMVREQQPVKRQKVILKQQLSVTSGVQMSPTDFQLPIYSQGNQIGVYKMQNGQGQTYMFSVNQGACQMVPVIQTRNTPQQQINCQAKTASQIKSPSSVVQIQSLKNKESGQIQQILVSGHPVPYPSSPVLNKSNDTNLGTRKAIPGHITLHIPAAETEPNQRNVSHHLERQVMPAQGGQIPKMPQQDPQEILRKLLEEQKLNIAQRTQQRQRQPSPHFYYQSGQSSVRTEANKVGNLGTGQLQNSPVRDDMPIQIKPVDVPGVRQLNSQGPMNRRVRLNKSTQIQSQKMNPKNPPPLLSISNCVQPGATSILQNPSITLHQSGNNAPAATPQDMSFQRNFEITCGRQEALEKYVNL